jgi:hypothetical protein
MPSVRGVNLGSWGMLTGLKDSITLNLQGIGSHAIPAEVELHAEGAFKGLEAPNDQRN